MGNSERWGEFREVGGIQKGGEFRLERLIEQSDHGRLNVIMEGLKVIMEGLRLCVNKLMVIPLFKENNKLKHPR